MPDPDLFNQIVLPLVAIVGGLSIGMTAVVLAHHRIRQRDEMETTLKLEMLERGLPAEEIERVIAVKLGRPETMARA